MAAKGGTGARWTEVVPAERPPPTPVYFDRDPSVLRLDQNTNPRSPPVVARAREIARRAELHRYGSARGGRLRRALAERYGVPESQLMVGNGSDEMLDTVARAFLGPGRRAAMFRPGYDLHEFFALREGATVREAMIDPFSGSPDGEARPASAGAFVVPPGFLDGVDVLYHASPHNPLGSTVTSDQVGRWGRALAAGTLVLDEAYAEFAQQPAAGPGPLWRDGLALPNVLFTRTFSKAWGLAGLRVGWAIGDPGLIDRLERARIPYTLGSFAEEMALEALSEPEFVEESAALARRERPRLAQGLSARGFRVLPSEANFLFTFPPVDGQGLWERLRAKGILVRRIPEVPGCRVPIRITVGLPEETDRLLRTLDEVLDATRATPLAPARERARRRR